MKVNFNTTEFVASHCRAPRGRGSWAFEVATVDGHLAEGPMEFSPSMTYTDAKKWMRTRATEWVNALPYGDASDVTVNVLP
jgi:hypothetical protein